MDRELVERLAKEAGAHGDGSELSGDAIAAFAALVAEECAKVCEDEDSLHMRELPGYVLKTCAADIRAKFRP